MQFSMIMACGTRVVSSSPYFFSNLCHTLFRSFKFCIYTLQVSHTYLNKQHRSSMKVTFMDEMCPYGYLQARQKYLLPNLPFLMGLNVTVWLLDAVVSSRHLTSILEIVVFRHLRNNWLEIQRMRTTVCTRRSLPLHQIGMPGYEATLCSTVFILA